MENKIYLFDTTLRDGQQTTGVNFTVSDKMIIANALDELGVDILKEVGLAQIQLMMNFLIEI